jgi:hypothetical protein
MPCARDVDSSVVIDSVGSGLRVRRIDGGQSVVVVFWCSGSAMHAAWM